MKNILIVEDDLGFVFWLGSALVAAGYQPWPACSASDATKLIEKAGVRIDLLIADPSTPGISKLVGTLRRSKVHLKVIALGAESKTKLTGINAWHSKPGPMQEPAEQQQEWLEAVKDVFIGHERAA